MYKKIAYLWQSKNLGEYSNKPFDDLFKGIGHNNGNLAFVHSIAKHLDCEVEWHPWHFKKEDLVGNVEAIVIPCANQLGGHTDLGGMAKKLEETGLPIIAIGVGAQANSFEHDIELQVGTKKWIDVIDALSGGKGTNIYTRGKFTTEQLNKIGINDTLPGGCPSHFLNEKVDLGRRLEANWNGFKIPRSICVAAGHEAWINTREIEHQLISLMMDTLFQGKYIPQSMGAMIKISRGLFSEIEPDVLNRIHQHTVPHYSFEEFKSWCLKYACSYYDVPSWMDELRRHDLTVGTRYHGIALALQTEKMGLTVTIDSRTRELCENTGVPHISVNELNGPITRSSLKKSVVFDGNSYDQFRSDKAKAYVNFLEANKLKPASYLYKIAGTL